MYFVKTHSLISGKVLQGFTVLLTPTHDFLETKRKLAKYSTMKDNFKKALWFAFSHQYQMNTNMLRVEEDRSYFTVEEHKWHKQY